MGAAVCAFGCSEENTLLEVDSMSWDCVYVVGRSESRPQIARCVPDGRLGPV